MRWVVGWAGLSSAGCLSFFCRENRRKNAESRFNVSIIPMWKFSGQFFIYVVTDGSVKPAVKMTSRVSGINKK